MKQLCQTSFYLCLGGLLLTAATSVASADAWNKKTYITTSQSIEVPGAVLPPGKYVFKLVESASDRHIVQIMNAEENHVYSTNLAIPAQRMEPADKTILTFYEMPGGGPEPVRTWYYPGDTIGQEFRYPRDRARMIAQATGLKVPTLAESRETAASVAQPTETTPQANETPAAPPAIAEATPPPPVEPAEPAPSPSTAEDMQQPSPVAPPPTTSQTSPTNVAPPPAESPAMPQTAGSLVAAGLVGLSCLGLATALRLSSNRGGSRS